jgi:hypothetical protein
MMEAHGGRIEPTLAAYNAARVLRTTRVLLQSRAIGEHVYHPAGAHAALRDAIMRAKSQQEWRDSLAWLYGGAGRTPASRRADTFFLASPPCEAAIARGGAMSPSAGPGWSPSARDPPPLRERRRAWLKPGRHPRRR